MNCDISHILQSWDYQLGEVMVRRIKGRDGLPKLQLRVDLGILQMNAEGRPDGKKPYGHPTYYDYLLKRLDLFVQENGCDANYKIERDQISRLHLEVLQYHHRYICLMQLQDFAGVERDTVRNLDVFDFVGRYSPSLELAWSLLQFRPQCIMILARARATPMLRKQEFDAALKEIEVGIQMLREFYQEVGRNDLQEQSVELESLMHWKAEAQQRPNRTGKNSAVISPIEKLQLELDKAISKEDYEQAALIRDQMRKLDPKNAAS